MHEENVSIILLNYNGERFLNDLFSSLLHQTYNDFRIIFVDNASKDNSLQIVHDLLNDPKYKELPIKILLSQENLGSCIGKNYGASEARGKYLVFLNNDTRLSPTWLEELLKPMIRDPTIGMCQSKIMSMSGSEVQTIGNQLDRFGYSKSTRKLETNVDGQLIVDHVFYGAGAAIMLQREVFERVGGYDKKFFMYEDDSDMGWRFRLMGYKIATSLSSICYHYGGAKFTDTRNIRRVKYFWYKNKLRLLLKNYSLRHVLTRVPVSFLIMLFDALYSSIIFGANAALIPWVKAMLWNVRTFRDTYRCRVQIQQSRKAPEAEIERFFVRNFILIEDTLHSIPRWLRMKMAKK